MTTSGVDQTLYLVSVIQQGTLVGTHTVEAADALSAINLVERYYSEPVRLERVLVEDEVGSQHEVTVANNWHGFMFEAQAIGVVPVQPNEVPQLENETRLPPGDDTSPPDSWRERILPARYRLPS